MFCVSLVHDTELGYTCVNKLIVTYDLEVNDAR